MCVVAFVTIFLRDMDLSLYFHQKTCIHDFFYISCAHKWAIGQPFFCLFFLVSKNVTQSFLLGLKWYFAPFQIFFFLCFISRNEKKTENSPQLNLYWCSRRKLFNVKKFISIYGNFNFFCVCECTTKEKFFYFFQVSRVHT